MDTSNLSLILMGTFVALALLAGLAAGLVLGRHRGRRDAESGLSDLVGRERDDAVRRSRAVIGGQVAEQLAPYLPDFPCDPSEARFLGKPVDFICFEASESDPGLVDEVVFVEVKSGGSSLSRTERSVREAIVSGRVRWVEYRIP